MTRNSATVRFAHAGVAITMLVVVLAIGCSERKPAKQLTGTVPKATEPPIGIADAQRISEQVQTFCGACHPVPPADDFPRDAWREEVQQGFDLYFQSLRSDLQVPLFSDVLAYYEARAPDELGLPASVAEIHASGLHFLRTQAPAGEVAPAVSHLKWMPALDGSAFSLLMCDMRSGYVTDVTLVRTEIRSRLLAKLDSPAHVESCDLDGDGKQELVVADLGGFLPADHDRGRVVWLKPTGEQFEQIVLADSLGRVADVRPLDADDDGDQDLMVAVFGWRRTGRILLLDNTETDPGTRSFTTTVVDPRHGAIHVPVLDMNGDGKLDFFSVLGQEHETVELFLSDGRGHYSNQRIFSTNTPTFGSSGIRPTDLDGDGDTDIIYTNGDMFDDLFLRKRHAIHWLENLGDKGWEHHELASMPGVHRAMEADLDGDGDLDIAACALIPPNVLAAHAELQLASLIWLEQTPQKQFIRHVLEVNRCNHAALETGDFDQDGDQDLAVGNFILGDAGGRSPLTIWWNESRADPSSDPE